MKLMKLFLKRMELISFTKFYSFPRVKYQILDLIRLDPIHEEYSHNLRTNIHY
jgi:hypothetical protein